MTTALTPTALRPTATAGTTERSVRRQPLLARRERRWEDLASISLAQINELATLQTRTDRKYVIPGDSAELVAPLLDPQSRVMEIDGRREFTYDSTYFDTPELACYRAAAHGHRRRFKLRTRLYADTGSCWFEVKVRGLRSVTVKDRIEHPVEQYGRITPLALTFMADRLATASIPPLTGGPFQPTLRSTYRRTTVLLPASGSRVTIDAGLAWQTPEGRCVSAGNVLVIETKTASSTAGSVDRALWAMGHRPVRLSKYATGLTLADPRLSGNRWHSVRQRQLQATTTEALR